MLTAHLEDRFRDALAANELAGRDESITFAVEFVRLLSRILPAEVTDNARTALQRAVEARCDLGHDEVEILIELALAPDSRTAIEEDELRAFGARFGDAEEQALRASLAELEGIRSMSLTFGDVDR